MRCYSREQVLYLTNSISHENNEDQTYSALNMKLLHFVNVTLCCVEAYRFEHYEDKTGY